MARYRTLNDWKDPTGDAALTAPEIALIDACRNGEWCSLGDGTRPDGRSTERSIRADLLRYLILGGCDDCRVDEAGVRLQGAYISGRLDLNFATATGVTTLAMCRFEDEISARQTRFNLLDLSGSAVPGLNAQGITVTGGVALSKGFTAKGKVSLSSANIGGQLSCIGGQFTNAGGDALNAQGITVTGSVFLSNGFTAKGEVSLVGAKIGGQLDCEGGQFENADGNALTAQRLRVEEGFFWREVTVAAGAVDLAAAHVSDLADDTASWPGDGRLILDGFTYDRISGAFTDAPTRLEWLAKGDHWGDIFFPQPYEQFARYLISVGRDSDARRVLIERKKRLGQYTRKNERDVRPAPASVWQRILSFPGRTQFTFQIIIRAFWDWLLRISLGYGLAPLRVFRPLFLLIGLCALLAQLAWSEGSFAPNSAVILQSPEWRALLDEDCLGLRITQDCTANPAQA